MVFNLAATKKSNKFDQIQQKKDAGDRINYSFVLHFCLFPLFDKKKNWILEMNFQFL